MVRLIDIAMKLAWGALTAVFVLNLAIYATAGTRAGRLARLLARVLPLAPGRFARFLAAHLEMLRLRENGNLEAAKALAQQYAASPDSSPMIVNTAVDVLISAGAYRAALAAEPTSYTPRGKFDDMGLRLIQINLAEAEYNLGRWRDAEQRLQRLDLVNEKVGLAQAGLFQQRAWIAAHLGRGQEALEWCERVPAGDLPREYRAEYWFTRTVAFLALGRTADAEAALSRGEAATSRLSSMRNALFLRAELAAAREDWAAVERCCRTAADHPFRGQGGAGLLLWAKALQKLGRADEAPEALRLAQERDPESESAALAASALAAA